MSLSDDYARWRDDPVTSLVFKALRQAADAQKTAWDDASWNGGRVRADDLKDTLQELRVRADAYRSLEELTVERLTELLGIQTDEQ